MISRRAFLFGLVFALCILIVPGQVYVRSGNLWDTYLEKNVESILMLFEDGELIVATCYMGYAVVIPWEAAFSEGREPKDLLVIIHNHTDIDRWSEMDIDTNRMFRNKGYAGPILLRLSNGKTIRWED